MVEKNEIEEEFPSSNDLTEVSDLKRTRRTSCGAIMRMDTLEATDEDTHSAERASSPNKRYASLSRPSENYFGIDSDRQKKRVAINSLYSSYSSWALKNYIIKAGDDARQEYFAMQLIKEFDVIFRLKKLKLLLTPYEIIPIGPDACMVEMVQDATSIDALKKDLYDRYNRSMNLLEFFDLYFGKAITPARLNFCHSLAAYSLLCYFLQIKDRHNGNILLHKDGRIVHIDFGFLFTTAPGKAIELEKKVPFKLLSEYVALLGDKARNFAIQFRK